MRLNLSVLIALSFALSIAACARTKTPAGTPANAPSAPTEQVGTGSNENCLTESPVDSSYESRKGQVKNEEKWLRDAPDVVITVIAPISLSSQGELSGSARNFSFEGGQLVGDDAAEKLKEKSVCTLFVQYGNEDYEAAIEAQKRKAKQVYPDLMLAPGTLKASQVGAQEGTTYAPKDKLPGQRCPSEPALTLARYPYGLIKNAQLVYPNGKPSKSTVTGFLCEGYNQKGENIRESLGHDKIGAVEL